MLDSLSAFAYDHRGSGLVKPAEIRNRMTSLAIRAIFNSRAKVAGRTCPDESCVSKLIIPTRLTSPYRFVSDKRNPHHVRDRGKWLSTECRYLFRVMFWAHFFTNHVLPWRGCSRTKLFANLTLIIYAQASGDLPRIDRRNGMRVENQWDFDHVRGEEKDEENWHQPKQFT